MTATARADWLRMSRVAQADADAIFWWSRFSITTFHTNLHLFVSMTPKALISGSVSI